MKFINVICPICGSKKNYTVIYPKNFEINDFNKNIFSARRIPDKIHYQLVKCNICGLVRSTPTIDTVCLYDLYRKSKLTYNGEIENLISTYIHAVKPILNKLSHSARLLEIGCGSGFVVKAIHDLGYIKTYGIDPSSDAIHKAHTSIKRNLKQSILKPKLFDKETFDFIFFFQTLDHIPDPNAFLKECYRLLKHNGYILAFNHNIDSVSSKIFGEKSPIIDIEHTFLYSPETISLLFKKNGFKINTVYSPSNTVSLRHSVLLFPIPKYIKKFFLCNKSKILDISINMQLGNICFVGQKI